MVSGSILGSSLGPIILVILISNALSPFKQISCQELTVFREEDSGSNVRQNNYKIQNSNIINLNGEEDNDEEVEEADRFYFKHHEDDHSLYSHRSLMSTENIVRQSASNDRASTSTNNKNRGSKYEEKDNFKNSDEADDFEAIKKKDFAEKEWQLMFRSFDLVYDSVSSSILQQVGKQTDLFEEVISRLPADCKRDILHIRDSAKKHKLWALRMLDSFGKIPSGVTYGRFSSPGDFEECLSVNVDELIYRKSSGGGVAGRAIDEHFKFKGQYCLLDFRLPLPERPKDKILSIHDPVIDLSDTELGKQFPIIKNYSGYASVFYEVGYMHAFCLPSTCDVQDLTKSIGQSLEGLYVIVNNTVDCEVKSDEPIPYRTSQVISLSLLIILFANAIFASFVHHFKTSSKRTNSDATNDRGKSYRTTRKGDKMENREDEHNEKAKEAAAAAAAKVKVETSTGGSIRKWLKKRISDSSLYTDCFSIQTNFNRLTKPDPRGLAFVHYTRIVAMALTVITHTGGLGTLQAITKPADTSNSEQIFRDLIPQMLANAFTSIQIFFFMAGFMLVISTYPSIKREKGHVSFIEYSIKRAIRLMPGIAATICLNFLWPLIVDGPMLSYFIRLIVVPCESNWWRTMAFLSNFDHVEKMCLRHSYFSASDYQLHIMAFPLLILLYKQPTLSLFIAAILTIAGFAAQVIMITTKIVLPFMMVDYIDKEAFFNVVHYIHHPVWNHMSAFFYGFIIGYFVVKQIRINLSEKTIKWLWIIILPSGIASIFAPYFWNHYKRPIYRWQMVLYVIFDRFILLTTCAWLSYATMVLARRKPSSRSTTTTTTSRQTAANQLNLPANIVGLDQSGKGNAALGNKEKSSQNSPEFAQKALTTNSGSTIAAVSNVQDHLSPFDSQLNVGGFKKSTSTTSIPRQRSSPNIAATGLAKAEDGIALNSPGLMRTIASSANIAISNSSSQEVTQFQQQQQTSARASPVSSNQIQNSATHPNSGGQRKNIAPVTEVNTLCLILSRLTFQLYLFNMVVLWVDVNHSKYYWFFSYYFIITKALAVYICSSLMAMVFFITLESPCLTLYIMWVKSRAQSRGNKREKREQSAPDADGKPKSQVEESPNARQATPTFDMYHHSSQQQLTKRPPELVATFDGLYMNSEKAATTTTASSVAVAKDKALPTLSFIDLSNSVGNEEDKGCDQTKM